MSAPRNSVAILYNVPLPADLLDSAPLTEDSARRIREKYPQLDLSELAVITELKDMVTALEQHGYEARAVNINDDLPLLLDELTARRPDVIFNLCESMHAVSRYEAYVAGIFELFRIPYTGATPEALSIAVRKVRTKILLQANGIPTPNYAMFSSGKGVHLNGAMRFPFIVKPSEEDASIGIEPAAIVADEAALRARVDFIADRYKQPALVEEYIDGREFNVAILGNDPPRILPISEIDFTELPPELPRIVSYAAKWVEDSDYYRGTKGKCPAVLPPDTEEALKDLAARAYRIIGCRDYARVDFRLSHDGRPYVLEVNPNPDLARDAGFMRSARTSGRSFEQTLAEIVALALARKGGAA
jgi:D-alanine-D-alanine ligase